MVQTYEKAPEVFESGLKEKLNASKNRFIQQVKPAQSDKPKSVASCRNVFYVFTYLGFCPPENYRILYQIWSTAFNLFVNFYYPISFIMSLTKFVNPDMEIGDLLTSGQVLTNVLGISIKVGILFYLFPQMLAYEQIVEKLDARCHTEEEFEYIRDFIKHGNRYIFYFIASYWGYVWSTTTSTVVFGRLPYNIYKPFMDPKESSKDFVFSAILEWFLMTMVALTEATMDAYSCIYVNILRVHIELLMRRIKKLNYNVEADGGDDMREILEENYEELKLCIIDHKNILELYNAFTPFISITVFLQFTITAILMSTTLLNLMIFATHYASMVACTLYMIAVILEVLPLCYYVQCLMDESDRLPVVIFHSNWNRQTPKYRTLLKIFMHHSQRTMTFTAGKLFPVTLGSFLSIAKYSFSLFTFIKHMNIKEMFGLEA